MGDRKIGRAGALRHIGRTGGIYGDTSASVIIAAAEIGGIDEGSTVGRELRHEGVSNAAETAGPGLQGMQSGEIRRAGAPRHVGGTCGVHGNPAASVLAA